MLKIIRRAPQFTRKFLHGHQRIQPQGVNLNRLSDARCNHQVTDVQPAPAPKVTEYVAQAKECPCCGTVTEGELPARVRARASFGAEAHAQAANLGPGHHVPVSPATLLPCELAGIAVTRVDKGEAVVELVRGRGVDLVVNTPEGRNARRDGYAIREAAVIARVPCITTLAVARAAVDAIAKASPRVETMIFGPADFMASINMKSLVVGEQPPGYDVGDAYHLPRGALTAGVSQNRGTLLRLGGLHLAGTLVVLGVDFLIEGGHWSAMLADTGSGRKEMLHMLRLMADVTNALAEGEVLQLARTFHLGMSEAECLEVIERKTAVLFSAAAEIGAQVSGESEKVVGDMAEYGMCLGVAFQLMDDALDYLADAETVGKPVGHDLEEGKITMPLIHAMANDAELSARVEAIADRGGYADGDREWVRARVRAQRGEIFCMEKAKAYAERAKALLPGNADAAMLGLMADLADFSARRPF